MPTMGISIFPQSFTASSTGRIVVEKASAEVSAIGAPIAPIPIGAVRA
ncbi:hypothetical protein FM113_17790 [Leucobacter sp. 7(1)]|nr:hypothetical protein FM113_17790 [Leucobacter sp. 7(1)]